MDDTTKTARTDSDDATEPTDGAVAVEAKDGADPADPAEQTTGRSRPHLDLQRRAPRYLAEMVIGLVLAGLIALALIATVGSVPFIYQGY